MAACGSAQYIGYYENRVDIGFVNALPSHAVSSNVNRNFLEVTIPGKYIKTKETTKPKKVKRSKKKLRFDEASEPESQSTRSSRIKMYQMDRNPTTRFSIIDLENINNGHLGDVSPTGSDDQKEVKSEPKRTASTNIEDELGGVKREDTLILCESGTVIPKKLATQEELDGAILAHVYFTTARSGKWPPFIISVPKDYNFMKLTRKAIAGMQKTIRKGERPCHDWIFKYHVNKQIPKMRKELKILFGRKKVEFRGTNLNKGLESAKLDPLVNRFWILPKK